jgi:hypothetical protein
MSPQVSREAVAVNEGNGEWAIRVKTVELGIRPIGPRLGRPSLPEIPLKAATRMDAEALVERWNHWFSQLKDTRSKKRKKRRT